MRFHSTTNPSIKVSLQEAVVQGLARDGGLYMPEKIPRLTDLFLSGISNLSFREISFQIAKNLIGDDLPEQELQKIIDLTVRFEAPLVEVEKGVFALELFHGPTLAFKDFGALFLSGLLGYFAKQQQKEITILVATSGDTGSAIANAFLRVPGTRVVVLYPSGKVSEIQEKQFTTLGANISALEIAGTFDDCQRLVKRAFLDEELNRKLFLTSANSINIARLIPQTFYYFQAFAQRKDNARPVVFSVPSGNFGNLTAGILAKRMGLPVLSFVAATNTNKVVPDYLQTAIFSPRGSVQTMSNAMDVGNPSNFSRLQDLYDHDFTRMGKDIAGFHFTDEETRAAMVQVFNKSNYVLDPHGAVAYLGLKNYLKTSPHTTGIFLETAHPGKFQSTVEEVLNQSFESPRRLQDFLPKEKQSIPKPNRYEDIKEFLLQ